MSEALKAVEIFTDGACSGNPGPGGWAAILRYGQHELEISGSMPQTTNNRMEVFAVISALGKLKTRCQVSVYSDSFAFRISSIWATRFSIATFVTVPSSIM